jgi:hypothetical protein
LTLFGSTDGDEIDPDRLENTPKIFLEKPFFFDDTGDVRPGVVLALSVVAVVVLLAKLSLRVLGRVSV